MNHGRALSLFFIGTIVSLSAATPDSAGLVKSSLTPSAGAAPHATTSRKGEYVIPSVGPSREADEAAAAAGDGEANYRLGLLYEFGSGVPRNYETARQHFETAAARGVAAGNYRLGMIYFEGWGVPRDRTKAIELMTRAAEANDLPAMRTLSKIYYWGLGAPVDQAKAVAWAEQAAKQDDPEAEFLVGVTSLNKRSPNVGASASRDWLRLSAEQDYTNAMVAMAGSYIFGSSGQRDLGLAKRWLELALESGDGDAGFLLALHELRVAGPQGMVPTDTIKEDLEKAAALKCFTAIEVLKLVKGGRTYAEALRYVVTVPQTVRYLEQQAKAAVRNNKGDLRPQVIFMSEPVYPQALNLSGLEGSATIEFEVDKDGLVRSPKVKEATHPAFGDSALDAVSQWRFLPGQKAGVTVAARMMVPVYFQQTKVPRVRSAPGN